MKNAGMRLEIFPTFFPLPPSLLLNDNNAREMRKTFFFFLYAAVVFSNLAACTRE